MIKYIVAALFALMGAACHRTASDDKLVMSFPSDDNRRLVTAVMRGDVRGVASSAHGGGNVNARNSEGVTPLLVAYTHQQLPAFRELLSLGADPNGTVGKFREPLMGMIAMTNGAPYLQLALQSHGDPNARIPNIHAPILFRAIDDADLKCLKLLVDAGADVNGRAASGETAVTYAAISFNFKAVLFLLNRGADPSIEDEAGLDVASALFRDDWNTGSEAYRLRSEIVRRLERLGYTFDQHAISSARIRNLREATGAIPPKWLANSNVPNPEWMKACPQEAEEWREMNKALGRH